MKKHLIQLFSAAALVFSLASCSDDDKLPGQDLEQKSYTDEEVTVSINGDNAGNQVVRFTPIAGEESKANITIASKPLNLSGMIGRADNQPMAGIPSAGIIPGSPEVTFPVELVGDAKNCTFAGTAESEYCTFTYSGAVTDSKLSLDLTDVKLKNASLAGTYKMGDAEGMIQNIATVKWEADSVVKIDMGWLVMPLPIETILSMTLATVNVELPTDSVKISALLALPKVLKEVNFTEDGNITAKYLDTKNPDPTYLDAPKGLAQYVVTGEGKMRVFLNVPNIIAASKAASKASRADSVAEAPSLDLTTIMSKIDVESLMTLALPLLSQGVPVNYGMAPDMVTDPEWGTVGDNTDPNFMHFYLDEQLLLPILKIFKPLLSDEEFCKTVVALASQDPDMGSMAPMLEGMLPQLPGVIDSTKSMQLGIRLHKQ